MHDATSSVDNLLSSCMAFCGESNIPLLIGVQTSYGFSLESMDRVCLGDQGPDGQRTGLLGDYAKGLMAECKERSEAIEEIKEKMAHLVAAVDAMKLEQVRFRAALQLKMKDFVTAISSKRFELAMQATKDKIGLYTKFLEAHMKDTLFANSEDRARMLESVKAIGVMGDELRQTMEKKMPLLAGYAERCGHPVLATSEYQGGGKYLLDLCFQDKALCIDNPESQHIGCCCGAVPAAGSFSIPAEPDGRRLQAARSHSTSSPSSGMDLCAEAEVVGKERMDSLRAELNETEIGRRLLGDFEAKLAQYYPEYFGRCAPEIGRRLREDDSPSWFERIAMKAEEALGIKHQPKVQKLHCEPPTGKFQDPEGTEETMKTAFWSQTEVDTCDELRTSHDTEVKTQDLADVCSDFCGSESVPMLIGSVAFGFNKSAMDSVCVDSSMMKTDEPKVKQCLIEATAMNAVEVKVAAAAASLMSLESAKFFYEASVRAMIPEMRDIINAESQKRERYADVGAKVTNLEKVLNRTMKSVTGNSAAAISLETALLAMGEKAAEVQETLHTALADFTHFIQDCDELFTGKGAAEEYLLDMCSQTSLECVEEDVSRHVGCCCGYYPLLSVGKPYVSLQHTIPGISASELSDTDGKARVHEHDDFETHHPRRLQAEEDFSICGSAYRTALPLLQATEEKIKKLGQERLLQTHLAQLSEKYPGYAFCEAGLAVAAAGVAGAGTLGQIVESAEAEVQAAAAGVEAGLAEASAGVEAGVVAGVESGAVLLASKENETDSSAGALSSQLIGQAAVGVAVVAFLWAFVSQVRLPAPSAVGLAEPMLPGNAAREAAGP
ncbi:unnamed protein product [Polarella glacialis]|uniref:Uncharacterized protein n=1 Tax=Polarella glacialis TaxID=89957 RepID=A0A813L410_POLGL|nr:unnamed protein product [Polarella glacialis]